MLLTLLCALLFLPGLSAIPPTDRDESRFMQATKQMLETGDWIHLKFQDEPRNKKPAGIYWLQALSVRAFGQELNVAWPYRIPSVIAAWLAVLITAYAGRKLFNPATGLAAGAILATSFIVVAEAHIAKTDAALLAATTAALVMLARLYTTREKTLWPALLFWIALGIGILIKGPLIVLVAAATIAALGIADRDVRWLKNLHALYGIPLMLVIVLPWLIAVSGGGTDNTQGSFLSDAVLHDLLPKLLGAQESHGAPPGTYMLSGVLTAWPWSLLAPFAVIAAWRQRAVPAVRFCLAWLIPAWIVFELVPTKLPHYTMPLYPALALLIARLLYDANEFKHFITGKVALAWRFVWAIISIGLGVGVTYAVTTYGDTSITLNDALFTILVVMLLTVTIAALAVFRFGRNTAKTVARRLVVAGTVFALLLTTVAIPSLTYLAISSQIVEAVDGYTSPVALAEFHEPSAVFLLGTHTLLTTPTGAAEYILTNPNTVAVVPYEAVPMVRTLAGDRTVEVLRAIGGYNYSRGRGIQLAVITIKASAEPSR